MGPYYWLFVCCAPVAYAIISKSGLLSSFDLRIWEDLVNKCLERLYPVKNSKGQRIPGPKWSWPDGQFFDKFVNGYRRNREWRQEFGHVYRVWASNIPEIVITTPEDVRAFFTDSSLHNKAPSSNAGWFFHDLLGDCVGFVNGDRWKQMRSDINRYFTHEALAKSTESLDMAVREHLLAITRDQNKKEEKEKDQFTIHADSIVRKLTFFCTAERIYGPMTSDEKNELWSISEQRLPLLRFVLAGPAYRIGLFRPFCKQATEDLASFQTRWYSFNKKMYESRRRLHSADQLILILWNSVQKGLISKSEMLQTFDEMLFANLDVNSHVLTWVVVHIAMNPGIQQGLREEAVFDDIHKDGLNKYIQQKNTLIWRCFLESMRLRPFTAFSIPESSPEDKIFDNDFHVAAKTSVIIDTVAINIDNEFWGDERYEFRPDRFKEIKPVDLRYNLFNFGFGTRKCLGQYFAEQMAKLCVINLLAYYDLAVVRPPGTAQPETDKTWIPASDMHLTLTRRGESNATPLFQPAN